MFQGGNHPEFVTRPCERPMTVRDLLTHTSGLTYGFMEQTNVDAASRRHGIGTFGKTFGGDLAALAEALATLPLEFSPGTAWHYAVSTDVCGMQDTGFFVPEEKPPRFAACYMRGPGKKTVLMDDPRKSHTLRPPRLLQGGGGLVSTAADYLRFTRMLLGGGTLDGARIASRKTLEPMTRNHLPGGRDLTETSVGMFAETAMRGTGFGLGFSVNLDPVAPGNVGSAGEFAWGGAASTIFWVDPAEDLIVVFLTQLFPSRTFNFRGQLEAIVYGAIDD